MQSRWEEFVAPEQKDLRVARKGISKHIPKLSLCVASLSVNL